MNARKTILATGWLAAAATAVAWFATDAKGREPASPDGGEHAVASATAVRSGGARVSSAKGGKTAAQPKKPWRKVVKEKRRTPEREPVLRFDSSDPGAFMMLLGDASPKTRALAKRINSFFDAKDVKGLLSCVGDAAASRNPAVKAMMVCSIYNARHFSFFSEALAKIDFSEFMTEEETEKLKARDMRTYFKAEDAWKSWRTRKCLSALGQFLADDNDYVSRDAAIKMLYMAESDGQDAETYISTLRDVVSAKGEDSHVWSYVGMNVKHLLRRDSDTGAKITLAMAQTIDGLEGDARKMAEEAYKEATGNEFSGVQGAAESAEWRKDVKEYGKTLFGSDEKGETFVDTLDYTARKDAGRYEGLESDIEDASKAFKRPNVALRYADLKESLRKTAQERYGDTPEGQKWLHEELDQATKKLVEYEKEKDAEDQALEKLMADTEAFKKAIEKECK